MSCHIPPKWQLRIHCHDTKILFVEHTLTHLNVMPCPQTSTVTIPQCHYWHMIWHTLLWMSRCVQNQWQRSIHCDNTTMPLLAHDLTHTALNVTLCPKSMAAKHPLWQYHNATIGTWSDTHCSECHVVSKINGSEASTVTIPQCHYWHMIWHTLLWMSCCVQNQWQLSIHCDNTTMPLLAHDLTHTALNVTLCPKSMAAKHPLWQYHNATIGTWSDTHCSECHVVSKINGSEASTVTIPQLAHDLTHTALNVTLCPKSMAAKHPLWQYHNATIGTWSDTHCSECHVVSKINGSEASTVTIPQCHYWHMIWHTLLWMSCCVQNQWQRSIHCDNTTMPLLAHDLTHTALNVTLCPKSMAAKHPLWQYHNATIGTWSDTHCSECHVVSKINGSEASTVTIPQCHYWHMIWHTLLWMSCCVQNQWQRSIHCDNTTMPLLAHDLTHTALNVTLCPKSMAAKHPLWQYHNATIGTWSDTHCSECHVVSKINGSEASTVTIPQCHYWHMIWHTLLWMSRCVQNQWQRSIHCDNTTMPLLAHDLTHTALNVTLCPKSMAAKHPLWQYHNATIGTWSDTHCSECHVVSKINGSEASTVTIPQCDD